MTDARPVVPSGSRHFPDAPGDMRERLRGLAALVSVQLQEDWCGADPLTEVAAYAVSAPGKLLRPLLLLESAASVGGFPVGRGYAAAYAVSRAEPTAAADGGGPEG